MGEIHTEPKTLHAGCYLCGRPFSEAEPGVMREVIVAQGEAEGLRESGDLKETLITLKSPRRICSDCDRQAKGPKWLKFLGLLLVLGLGLALLVYFRPSLSSFS